MVDGIFFITNKLRQLVATFLRSDRKELYCASGNALNNSEGAAGAKNFEKPGAAIERFKCVSRHSDNEDSVMLKNYVWASNDEESSLHCSATPLQDIGPQHLT